MKLIPEQKAAILQAATAYDEAERRTTSETLYMTFIRLPSRTSWSPFYANSKTSKRIERGRTSRL